MKTINEQWKGYEVSVLPKDAGEVQRRETKRAFFAGFLCCLTSMEEVSKLSDEEADAAIISYQYQLDGFTVAVKMGEA